MKASLVFSGMRSIVNWCEGSPVKSVRFSRNTPDLIAIGGGDGLLRIGRVPPSLESPQPVPLLTLKGHRRGIADFQWGPEDDMIASIGDDGSFRLWKLDDGSCLRHWSPPKGKLNAIQLHPKNSNSVLVGGDAGVVHLLNMSTGKSAENDVICSHPITALQFDPSGEILFVGDASGTLHICFYAHMQRDVTLPRASSAPHPVSPASSSSPSSAASQQQFPWADFFDPLQVFHKAPPALRIKKLGRVKLSDQKISSLSFQSLSSQGNSGTLAVITGDSRLILLAIPLENPGSISKYAEFSLPATSPIRSVFCRHIPALATGSQDGTICFFGTALPVEKHPFNELMGHSGAVLDVSWNCDESLLASSDDKGTVVVWRRAPRP